ncbi:uncharacterized protein [Amphiura filiformis]|uniref:uncharacterized protein n=1 Tax=Amphiura filiformis TaxID=82378 RepID=UPI003B2192F2
MSDGNIIHVAAGSFHEGNIINDTIVSLTSDQPIMVVQYMKGAEFRNARDNPSMLIIPPITLFTGNVTFPVIEYTNFPTHTYYINIVIECDVVDGLFIDGSLISKDPLQSHDQSMCCVRSSLSSGSHTVSHGNPTARFFVSVYAVSIRSSYAYAANIFDSSEFYSSESSYMSSPRVTISSIQSTTYGGDESTKSKFDKETAFIVGAIAVVVVLIWIIMIVLVVRRKQKRNSYTTGDESVVTGPKARIDSIDPGANNGYETHISAGNGHIDDYQEINNGSQEYASAYVNGEHPTCLMHLTGKDGSDAYAATNRVPRPFGPVAEAQKGGVANTFYGGSLDDDGDKTHATANAQEGWMDNPTYSSR